MTMLRKYWDKIQLPVTKGVGVWNINDHDVRNAVCRRVKCVLMFLLTYILYVRFLHTCTSTYIKFGNPISYDSGNLTFLLRTIYRIIMAEFGVKFDFRKTKQSKRIKVKWKLKCSDFFTYGAKNNNTQKNIVNKNLTYVQLRKNTLVCASFPKWMI